MGFHNYVGTVVTVLLVLVALSLVAGQLLGQPVLLSYVETGSMEPTIETGDGFVAIPTAVAGDIEEGDVIIFEAEEIEGGGLTTHRVVGETDRGYITRGDANPFTDQDSGEPPVQEAQIVSKAWQLGGSVVVIPHLGIVVMALQDTIGGFQRQLAVTLGIRGLVGPQGAAYLLMGISGVAYVADYLLTGSQQKDRTRSTSRDGGTSTLLIVGVLALILVSTATAAMVAPAGAQEFGVVSAEFESESSTVIPAGESNSLEFPVPNSGLVPTHVYFEPGDSNVEINPSYVYVGSRSTETVTVTLHAPGETGYYRMFLHEHRYLAVLPEPVITGLYETHPWLPLIVVDALLGGSIVVIGYAVLGTNRIRVRKRDRPSKGFVSTNLLKKLYR